MNNPWSGNSNGAIDRALSNAGFADVTSFAKARESSSFRQLVDELQEPEIAPIHLMKALRLEAVTTEQFQYLARTMLARYLRERLTAGWKQDGRVTFPFAHAVGSWIGFLGEEYRPFCQAVIENLTNIAFIPDGWVPQTAADPALVQAFAAVIFPLSFTDKGTT